MFKKTTRIEDTAVDCKIKNLGKQLSGARSKIISAVEHCIIQNGVINLYFDGPDKEKAIEDAECSKWHLRNCIAEYDDLMAQYSAAVSNPNGKQTTIGWTNNHSDSHKLVEITYRNFYKRS